MDDILIIEATERYLRGELSAEEKSYFERLRKEDPQIDQLVVEHTMFLQQLQSYGDTRDLKHKLHETHSNLLEKGEIKEIDLNTTGGKIMQLWKRYKKVTAIAASIAFLTAILISTLVSYFSPASNKNDIVKLNRKIEQVLHKVNVQNNKLNVVLENSKVPVNETASNGGTSFLIDGKGYLVTNAHVVAGASTILVQNNKGEEFKAIIAHIDNEKDLAILKIDDGDYKPLASLPYTIRKTSAELGEQVFTLGFPREEIVYNEGYMSAKTGFNGDTMSCQIAVSANPGNSGGPVFNKNGDVIGILSTAQSKAQGVVFAIKSKNVYQAIEELKKEDTAYANIKTISANNMRGMDRVQQIKQLKDCVFMVRSFTR